MLLSVEGERVMKKEEEERERGRGEREFIGCRWRDWLREAHRELQWPHSIVLYCVFKRQC
jgi:hypothetical protein